MNGNGFFAVNEINGVSTGATPSFSNTQYYTRAGDFSADKNGYLVNSAGQYLDGYMADPATGALNTNALTQINVNNVTFRPTATSTVSVAPILAGSPSGTGAAQTSTQTVFDASGTGFPLGLSWTQTAGATAATTSPAAAATDGTWSLTVNGASAPAATVVFNADGSMQSVTPTGGTATTSGAASLNIGAVVPGGSPVSLNLGTIGSKTGTTMSNAAGAAFSPGASTQDGTSSLANYKGFTMGTDGSVVANFDNGQSQLIAKVPLATFGNADALQAQDGQAYTATSGSGVAALQMAGQNSAGSLETKSVNGSTDSLDTDLTKLIVAQQAYGASAKVVTTAEQMLQTALTMKQ